MIRPVLWLRIEGLAVLLVSLFAFHRAGGEATLLLWLILAPDLSMLGYLGGRRTGALCYNAAHSYALPLVLLGAALAGGHLLALHLALVWTAHVGLDRALGYGLKLETGFQDTHLGRIGRARAGEATPAPLPADARPGTPAV